MSRSVRALAVPEGGFQRIAVLRLSSLGDVILTQPVVHALRRAYPNARIEYWVKEEFAVVVRHDPAITHVRALERGARRLEDVVSTSAELESCDLIVDLHANSRTRVLTPSASSISSSTRTTVSCCRSASLGRYSPGSSSMDGSGPHRRARTPAPPGCGGRGERRSSVCCSPPVDSPPSRSMS